MDATVRDAQGKPFSKWKPAEKFAHVWREQGLEGDDLETEYEFHPTRRWRMDFAWPSQMVAVEIDGFGYGHQAQQQMAADNEKQNAAVSLGWKVFRFNSRQLGSRAGVEDAVGLVSEFMCCGSAEDWASDALSCICRGIDLMSDDQVGEWEGVRGVLGSAPVPSKARKVADVRKKS